MLFKSSFDESEKKLENRGRAAVSKESTTIIYITDNQRNLDGGKIGLFHHAGLDA